MNANHYFRHYENNSTIVADTASLVEQSSFIKNGELLAICPVEPTEISQASAKTGM